MATQDPYNYMMSYTPNMTADATQTPDWQKLYTTQQSGSYNNLNQTPTSTGNLTGNLYDSRSLSPDPMPPTTPTNPYSNYGNIFDPATWKDTAQAQQYQTYIDNTLPLAQYQQNQYQYGTDFAEAQRRFNEEMMRQQGNDLFQQNLSTQQMDFAKWQAEQAGNQWNQQFTQQQANDLFSQGLANRQLTSSEQQQAWLQQFQQGQQNWNMNLQQQQQDLGMRQADIEEMYRKGLIDSQTAQNEINRMNIQFQNDQANRGMDIQSRLNEGNLQLGTNRLALDQRQQELMDAINWARIGNEGRGMDIQQELNRGNLGLGQGRLGLDTQLGMGNLDLSKQRLLQDAQLAAEQRATQEKIAAIQASGRSQLPTTRFIANW